MRYKVSQKVANSTAVQHNACYMMHATLSAQGCCVGLNSKAGTNMHKWCKQLQEFTVELHNAWNSFSLIPLFWLCNCRQCGHYAA